MEPKTTPITPETDGTPPDCGTHQFVAPEEPPSDEDLYPAEESDYTEYWQFAPDPMQYDYAEDYHPDPAQCESTELFDADPVLRAAQEAFGITYLYPWQRLVIANILDDDTDPDTPLPAPKSADSAPAPKAAPADTNAIPTPAAPAPIEQIVLLPTGAGKSMCFMVPAMMLPGPTLILYPLLALMNDQARRLTEGGIECVTFRGGQTESERDGLFTRIAHGAKVILANPEVLQNKRLVERLSKVGISHVAIDEAHCVSEWGDSFRPAYLTLGAILERLNVRRVTAFTATASDTVLDRVNEVLFNRRARVVRSEADRPNIHYYVHYAACKEKAVLELAEREEKPLLVFCGTRRRAERMALLLEEQERELHPDHTDTVRFYHAGLTREEKTAVEQWFYPKTYALMASTCAFGMGVDKKDIRTVIHLDVPATAEAFIQEAGRGGRDGGVAKSFLVWSPEDMEKTRAAAGAFAFATATSTASSAPVPRALVMARFALLGTCRRQVLLDALSAEQAACQGCDICLGTASFATGDLESVYQFVRRHNRQFTADETATHLAARARQKQNSSPWQGILRKRSARRAQTTSAKQTAPAPQTNLERDDYLSLIALLKKQGRLKTGRYAWKNKLYAGKG